MYLLQNNFFKFNFIPLSNGFPYKIKIPFNLILKYVVSPFII